MDVGSSSSRQRAGPSRQRTGHPFADTWVVVPAYNESAMIGRVIAELGADFPNIVVVDDGSTDRTAELALAAGAEVLRHVVNLGQGAALQTGIELALRRGAARIGTFDADGQHRPGDLVDLLDALEEGVCEVVLGSRFLAGGDEVPLPRRLLLRTAVLFTRTVTSMAITDAHNGLRALSRRAARAIDLKSDRMAHASELLDQIARARLPYRELPVSVRYTDYSLAKGQRSTDAVRVLADYLVSRVFD